MQLLVFAMLLCWIGVVVRARAQKPAPCDPRYFQHYWRKECKPVFGPGDSRCPVRFICPESIPEDQPGCKLGDRNFYFGEDVPTDDPCKTCICGEGWYGKPPNIVCKAVGCSPDCYETYGKDKCFSTYKLWGVSGPSQPICEHHGKTYSSGQVIYFDEDPCLMCDCHDGWTGQPERDRNCRRNWCGYFIPWGRGKEHLDKMAAGCLPLYDEGKCCPFDYDCGENVRNTTTPLATDDEIESGDSCFFKGSHYRIGQLLDIGHSENCLKCECVTPPEFTCVRQVCPWPKHFTCVRSIIPGQCCPHYECSE